MTRAYVNGVECIVYGYEGNVAYVKFGSYRTVVPVVISLIEIRREEND